MTPTQADTLRQLLEQQETAALGTLHRGEPFVSMVPYALLPAGRGLVIHVSRLSTHTADMQQHPGVSVLVCAVREPGVAPQGLARATLQGDARFCAETTGEYTDARAAYVARYPDSEPMFSFGDFSLVVIVPRSVRVVGGFAQAWTASASDYLAAMSGGKA